LTPNCEDFDSYWKDVPISKPYPVEFRRDVVAVQSFTEKSKLMIDHRAAGLFIAIIALFLKAPFPIVVIAAAATSATVFHFA